MLSKKRTTPEQIERFGEFLGHVRHIVWLTGLVAIASGAIIANLSLDAKQQQTLDNSSKTLQGMASLLAEYGARIEGHEQRLNRVEDRIDRRWGFGDAAPQSFGVIQDELYEADRRGG